MQKACPRFHWNVMHETAFVTVGKIVKPFGVRGQVRVLSLTDRPGRLENLHEVMLETVSGQSLVTTVMDVWGDGRSYVVQLAAFSTPEEVGLYRGAWLKIPQSAVPPAPEGQYYQFELIGLTVKEECGNVLGVLEEVIETLTQHVFVIRGQGREFLLPAFKKWIVKVDIPGQEMTVVSKEAWSGDDAV